MELLQQTSQVIDDSKVIQNNSSFIEANTKPVTLEHLKRGCTVPVFAKDNEVTISHAQFIEKTMDVAQQLFPDYKLREPQIRVSHVIKGRIPTAIGKAAKELLDHEKTIYYERCAFILEIPQVTEVVNGNTLSLSIGGVRAYNQENLYSRKSLEKFKFFIGFQNKVCTNLCLSTDGYTDDIRVASLQDLEGQVYLFSCRYNKEKHLGNLEMMSKYQLSEIQFAHLIGKLRMYPHLSKQEQKSLYPMQMNDSQINHVVKDYYKCPNFCRNEDGGINLYRFYNLLTGANKSSYIDHLLDRGLFAYEFTKHLCISLENNTPNWYLYN